MSYSLSASYFPVVPLKKSQKRWQQHTKPRPASSLCCSPFILRSSSINLQHHIRTLSSLSIYFCLATNTRLSRSPFIMGKIPAGRRSSGKKAPSPSEIPLIKSWVCSFQGCGQRYTAQSSLRVHHNKVHAPKTRPCTHTTKNGDKCSERFHTLALLDAHLRVAHSHFVCKHKSDSDKVCGHTCDSKEEHDDHLDDVHRTFACGKGDCKVKYMTRHVCHQHQRSCKGQGSETVEIKLPACINKASNGNYYNIALQKCCVLRSNFLFCLFF